MGIGKFLRGLLATVALFRMFYMYRVVAVDSVDQAIECTATGRNVCRQFRNQDQADAHSDPAVYGVVDCDYDSLFAVLFPLSGWLFRMSHV